MCVKQNHNMLKDSKTPKEQGASYMGDNNESSDCALAVINIFQPCDYHYSNKYL